MKTAMISGTSVDLPEHRQEAIDACLREGVFPVAMEHLPAKDADATRVSLEMVNKADIYIDIYAWRYGHIPEGHDISITEMEFDRAVKRKIPILVFLIHMALGRRSAKCSTRSPPSVCPRRGTRCGR